jgi:IS30 family transposase
VANAVIKLLKPLSVKVHTRKVDNGKELTEHALIAKELKTYAYFTHPYSSWGRPSNENSDGLIRQPLPWNTNCPAINERDIESIKVRLNSFPECVGDREPRTEHSSIMNSLSHFVVVSKKWFVA